MKLLIQKFGGTSVGNLECMRNVADIIIKSKQQGSDIVAVVSAMAGETDRLISLAKSAALQPDAREYDALISTGEQVSAALLAVILNELGYPARSMNAQQAQIYTDPLHRKATILKIDTNAIRKLLAAKIIPVITGFQGVNEAGEITTIGRGGSDTSAVMLASALHADECQIYTDVDGVYTSDPRIVKDARLLERITFNEMLELSSLGAKVLQRSAVQLANQQRVPLRVLSSFNPGPGTLITFEDGIPEQPQVSGIAFDRNQAKLTIHGIPNHINMLEDLMTTIREAAIEIDVIVHNPQVMKDHGNVSFTVPLEDFPQALSVSNQFFKKFHSCDIIGNDRIAKLSLVGLGMKTHASVASKILAALQEEGIPIHLITSSEIKITVVIDEKYTELGARALHAAFELGSKQI